MSYARYRRNPYYLLHAHATRSAILVSAVAFMLVAVPSSREHVQWPWLLCSLLFAIPSLPIVLLGAVGCLIAWAVTGLEAPTAPDLLWISAGIILGLYSAAIMHVCSHGKPTSRVWRHLLGELCAIQQLTGFQDWTVVHMLHHAHSDDPVHDPHYASRMGFFQYAATMKFKIARFLERHFLDLWHENPNARSIWNRTAFLIIFGHFAASVLWLVLLGPRLFVVCFVTSLLTNAYFYAHFNYFTHRPDDSGEVQILNLQAGLYPLFNWMLLGIFYHKNHHAKPAQINPMTNAAGLTQEP